jgi:tryptophan synthase alpha subunit
VVARLGVTGAGQDLDLNPLFQRLEELQGITERPLAVGFGLADPASMAALRSRGATPVIGSALVPQLAQGCGLAEVLSRLTC